MLLIAAGTVEDERLAAEDIAGSAAGVDVWVVPGSDHTRALATAPEEWERRVVAVIEVVRGA